MKIKINETWFLEPQHTGGFDLNETKTSKKGKEYVANHGYNMTMERCIKTLVHHNISHSDVTLDLGSFLSLYKHELDKVGQLLQASLKIA